MLRLNSYTPVDFALGLKTQLSLERILLHYRRRGLCMDAPWRNVKNDGTNVTNIFTVDEGPNFTPGTCIAPLRDRLASYTFLSQS